jgi:penicillin G amidase
MMRARNGREFASGLAQWRFPTANCVYADKTGVIGYSAVGAIPVRSRSASDFDGRYATMGTGASNDWQGFVPHELLPQVTNPRDGVLFSANHRPAASFYTIPMGLSTGSMGDTIRSWRLRELLQGTNKFTPEAVLEMHYDTVNPARRDIVRLGLHIRSGQGGLSEDSLKALNVLEKWLEDGASSDLRKPGADLATRLSTFFRFVATPLAGKFGGGESGLARFLKDATARIAADRKAELEPDEVQFINGTLAAAWSGGSGERPAAASGRGQQRGPSAPMLGWFESLDGFGSLAPRNDLPSSPISCLDGQTIHCQSSQSYTQYVPLEDADRAQSICPIGRSDRPGSDYRTSTSVLWGQGKLHPAPLTRPAVEKITAQRRLLSR